jgi:hypothetical protein
VVRGKGKVIPVDIYMRFNADMQEEMRDDGLKSLFKRMDADEYAVLYGLKEDDEIVIGTKDIMPKTNWELMDRRQRVQNIMSTNPDKITILSECPCQKDKKLRHHPDYSKPFEVELLCRKCHGAAHRKLRLEALKHPSRPDELSGDDIGGRRAEVPQA